MGFRIECPICHNKYRHDDLTQAVLGLEHHPECDEKKGIPIDYNGFINDEKFD